MAQWYYGVDGRQLGPVADDEIAQLAKNGVINGLTLVWRAGQASWAPLSEVDALKAAVQRALAEEDEEGDDVVAAAAAPAPAAAAAPATFFYSDTAGTRQGPVSVDAAASLAAAGLLDASSLVWMTGMPSWAAAGSVPAISAAVGGSGGGGGSGSSTAVAGVKRKRPDASLSAAAGVGGSAEDEMAELLQAASAIPGGAGAAASSARPPAGSAAAGASAGSDNGIAGKPPPAKRQARDAADGPPGAAPAADGAGDTSASGDRKPQSGGRGGGRGGGGGGGGHKRKQHQQQPRGPVTWIHITGLPVDATEVEVHDLVKKAGVVQLDYETSEPIVKIVTPTRPAVAAAGAAASVGGASTSSSAASAAAAAGEGSAAAAAPPSAPSLREAYVCYLKPASVDLAVQLLDEADFRPGMPLRVVPCPTVPRGIDPHASSRGGAGAAAGHRKLTPQEQAAKVKALEQQAALSWAEEGDESLGLHIVVLSHMFTPQEAASSPTFLEELEEDVVEEAAKHGDIASLVVYAKHPDGVIMIKYRSAGAAAAALAAFNGRFFGGRRISCEFWDGVTRYGATAASGGGGGGGGGSGDGDGGGDSGGEEEGGVSAEEQARLDRFGAWLEGQEGEEE